MILSAEASPIPGRIINCSLVAELISIISCFEAVLASFFVAAGVFVAVDGVWPKLREQAISRAQAAIAICVRRFLKCIIFLLREELFHTLPLRQLTNQNEC